MSATLVLDNTPLSHFARAGRLEVLQSLVSAYRCVAPAQVATEILDGLAEYPALAALVPVFGTWIEVIELTAISEVVAFARYKAELGGGPAKNNGEAAVLAWTSLNGGTAVIDERSGTRLAQRDGLAVHGTLWLVVNGIRQSVLTRADAARMVDELAATDMALPCDGAGLVAWAYAEGLLP